MRGFVLVLVVDAAGDSALVRVCRDFDTRSVAGLHEAITLAARQARNQLDLAAALARVLPVQEGPGP